MSKEKKIVGTTTVDKALQQFADMSEENTKIMKNVSLLHEALKHGIYVYYENDELNALCYFHIDPKNLEVDYQNKLIIAYWQGSKAIYNRYPLEEYGREWFLHEEDVL